ncbi:NADH-quinone oxidoreductase subunit A [Candidatus Alkanophaga liquidiphilum]|nr:MAG: NADH-quinone oxidoreductase subunit A [Candidatus Alkanophagales archaeon]
MMLEAVAAIGTLIAVCLITDLVMLILIKIFPKYYPSELKSGRFEAGNVPLRYPRWTLPMQYFGFMFLFMAVEPIIVLLLVLSSLSPEHFLPLLLISLLLLLPTIYVGYKMAVEGGRW